MHRLSAGTLCFTLGLTMTACLARKQTTESNVKTEATKTEVAKTEPAKSEPVQSSSKTQVDTGILQAGQASGNYTAKGEVVELKYAYAGHGQPFGHEAMIILLTDKPIPAEAVAEEIKSQTMLLSEKIRGLEYAIEKDGHWVRYHPSQYQESTFKALKEYTVEGDIVRGVDENSGDTTNGKYSRSVKFVATIIK
jgi:hypothetical protein